MEVKTKERDWVPHKQMNLLKEETITYQVLLGPRQYTRYI